MRPLGRRPTGRVDRRPSAVLLVAAAVTLAGSACLGTLGSSAGATTASGIGANHAARLVSTPGPTPAPTVAASPSTASAPAVITLTGTNFDPTGSTVTCQFTSGTPATSTTLTLAHSGHVSGTIRLTSDDAVGTNPIVCSQTSRTHVELTASAPFKVTTVMPDCAVTTSPPTCPIGQIVGSTVTGTDLSYYPILNATPNASGGVNPTNGVVALSRVTLGNKVTSPACRTPEASHICATAGLVASNGHLNTIVVNDDRGDLAGWTVTGELTSHFQGPTAGHNHSIPASDLTWYPSVSPLSTNSCVSLGSAQACGPSDVISEITPGPTHALSTSTAAVLCQADPGGGGGGTKCTAKFVLAVPPYIVSGQYTATIDIVVS
jgi:hypothetical protein